MLIIYTTVVGTVLQSCPFDVESSHISAAEVINFLPYSTHPYRMSFGHSIGVEKLLEIVGWFIVDWSWCRYVVDELELTLFANAHTGVIMYMNLRKHVVLDVLTVLLYTAYISYIEVNLNIKGGS